MARFAYDIPVSPLKDAGDGRADVVGAARHWTAPLPDVLHAANGLRLKTLKDALELLSALASAPLHSGARQAALDAVLRAARTASPDDVAQASQRMARYLALRRRDAAI